MKRPYLTEDDRFLIKINTTHGAFRMLHFRFMQLGKAIGINDRVIKIGYVVSILAVAGMAIQLLYQIYKSF